MRTARVKGLEEQSVVESHALRNAPIPTLTVQDLTTGGLLAGAVLTETIFSWPRIGSFTVAAVLRRHHPALLGVTFNVAAGAADGS